MTLNPLRFVINVIDKSLPSDIVTSFNRRFVLKLTLLLIWLNIILKLSLLSPLTVKGRYQASLSSLSTHYAHTTKMRGALEATNHTSFIV